MAESVERALRPVDVLDVGCGTGKVAALLADRGRPALGVEADERIARLACDHGIRVALIAGSRRNSPGPW